MEALHAIKQKEPHKRSKRGCLQCRKRRKKCPEDYQELSNGYWACSACETRGQKCKLPSRITSQQQRPQGSGTSSIIHDSATSSHTPKSTQLVNNVSSFQRQSVSTEASDVEHSWLDTFLEEFMALTEPSLPTIAPATSPRSAFDLLSFAISQQSNTGNERNCSDQAIERMIRSDDLDDLLIKSAHVYDTFLCAIIDTSTMAGNASLIDHLMDITRSNNVCKASMVSCCLAYTDVIERERQNPRGPSRFVQYLLKGTKKANSSATASTTTIPSRQVSQWLKYATDGFHRSKSTMSLAAKLLTLLNLRFACICFLGAKDASALANDIHIVLSEVRIDMAYLRSTARKGTPLSVIIQALAFANIMDAASMKGVRAAISNETTEKAAALEVDLAINPRADLNMVTVLSIDLVECIKRISDLSADISEGHLHLPIDIEAKSEEIKMLILVSISIKVCACVKEITNNLYSITFSYNSKVRWTCQRMSVNQMHVFAAFCYKNYGDRLF